MLQGFVDEATATEVRGWALDSDAPGRPLKVDISVNGIHYASLEASQPRQDLREQFGHGNHGFCYEFSPPLPLLRNQHIQVRFGGTSQVLPNGERLVQGGQLDPQRLLQPILVTAPGRAGSTVLMQKLAGHPSVSVAKLYPFETELLKYYGHAFSILTAPGDHDRSGTPEAFVDNSRFLGANPYYVPSFARAFTAPGRFAAFYGDTVPRELARSFRELINRFYTLLAEDHQKPRATFFAEKGQLVGTARSFARNLFHGAREIVLVRDPRDTLCSYRSFWSHPIDEAIRLLRLSTEALLSISKEQRADVLIVRYEDLVEQEAATLRRCSAFIGIPEFPDADPAAEEALFRAHGTSASPAASIGRWRRDLTAADVATCAPAFAEFLKAFGYEQ